MEVKLPLGKDDFRKLRESNCYYIDKTLFIQKLLEKEFEVNLITRPRRFGKTLTMSMLEDFFNIEKDSGENFTGLQIMENTTLCSQWMNQWPVLFLSLKSVEGMEFSRANERFKILMADVCKKYAYLEHSPKTDNDDKILFRKIKATCETDTEACETLYLLTRMMTAHYGKPVILLIDEYDVPLARASEENYYKSMLELIRALLGKALKTNEFLKFAVITGCLKIAKESIFTGTNNFVSDTITGDRFDEFIGFTESDVHKLLLDTGFTSHAEEIKQWYDGYRFGTVDVYCPWDVLNHVAALQENPCKKPQNYWGATSHNGIIYRFISREDLDVNSKFEILMAGGTLTERITEDLTYDTLTSTESNLWSLLFMTGYLTQSEPSKGGVPLNDGEIVLRIPNEELKYIFKTAIIDWFQTSVKTVDRKGLFDAMWLGKEEQAAEQISDILFNTISYHDYLESYYHAFLAGLFTGAGYIVESNYELGNGRPDVVIKDKKNRRAMVIEAKHAKTENELPVKCMEAVAQIQKRQYALGLDKGYRTIISYGIAFFQKECMVKKA